MKAMPPWLVELRQQTPVTQSCIYLQTGTRGPLGRPGLAVMREAEELAAREGPTAAKGRAPLVEASEAARAGLARLLTVPPRELCWSLNTSTAMRTVLRALGPAAVDRIVTSDQEHGATRSLCAGLRDACGLSVEVMATNGDDTALLARLDAALSKAHTGRTILLLSHVSCLDGRRLPAAESVALARLHGAVSLVDGAQAVGQVPVDLRRIDADFYVASGHKWLLGPAGVGYIHVHADRLADFNPNWLPDADRAGASAAALGEAGAINWAQRAALGAAVQTIAAIGVETIAAHTAGLAQRLRAGLRRLPRAALLGDHPVDRSTGLVAFQVGGYDAAACAALAAALDREDRIVIKFQPECAALRVSLAAFNTDDDVDALLAALRRRCKE